MIFQIAEEFFRDISHHVGFPLRPFTDLLCIHGYHPTLYTIEPSLRGSLHKSGPLDFATKNTFALFFVGEEALVGVY